MSDRWGDTAGMAERTLPFPTIEQRTVKLKHPFSMIITGSSGCGKTDWILQLIKHRDAMITPKITRVIYSYKKYQRVFDAVLKEGGVEFVLTNDYTINPDDNTLLILDDQLLETGVPLAELFTVRVHHESISCIYVSHTLFRNDPQFRLASLNTNYFVLFKSVRGPAQVNHLAHQLFLHDRERSRRLIKAYADATRKPYTYLLIDLLPTTPDSVRLRAEILPHEGHVVSGVPLTKSYPL